ncbi:AraC family transcriptional regulator [Paenibacillus sp. KQZ6P-2]|uniref:AraC family transcriptional regulator n=1 Tax=Paenibacillus mangrovi TaxID=2931978 RepID=A0A9X1WR67_9BACL|nr:AraC family transcriptional regulator [Paenibacillus mangrovi]MCJ8013538.1 AraC family transcriptional regulator [Paenibacillus mangrovi]
MIVSPYELILYFGNDHISFLTNKVDASNHSHHYIQLTVGLEQNVNITIAGQPVQAQGVILQSNTVHRLDGSRQWQWYLLINPESMFGELLKRTYFNNKSMHVLDNDQVELLQQLAIQSIFSVTCSADYGSAIEQCKQILQLEKNSIESILDERIQHVLQIIETHRMDQMSVKALSERMYLSESRLSHLFKEKVGISLASYIVHHKLEAAFHYIFGGSSITEAAIEAGFNSSSHFSSTARDKLGMAPRSIVQNSRYLKV